MAAEALALQDEGKQDEGKPISNFLGSRASWPSPRTDAVAVPILIAEELPAWVRVNKLPQDVLEEIDAYAERQGFTRSSWRRGRQGHVHWPEGSRPTAGEG